MASLNRGREGLAKEAGQNIFLPVKVGTEGVLQHCGASTGYDRAHSPHGQGSDGQQQLLCSTWGRGSPPTRSPWPVLNQEAALLAKARPRGLHQPVHDGKAVRDDRDVCAGIRGVAFLCPLHL